MNIYQIIIALAAIWGAGLSSYIAIRNFGKEKPRIKVKLSNGFLVSDNHQLSPPMIFLEAANIGTFDITLSSCGLKLPSKNMPFMYFTEPGGPQKLPYELGPRKNFRAWMKRSDIINDLQSHNFKATIKISGIFEDAVGNSYTSKTLNFKLNSEQRNPCPSNAKENH